MFQINTPANVTDTCDANNNLKVTTPLHIENAHLTRTRIVVSTGCNGRIRRCRQNLALVQRLRDMRCLLWHLIDALLLQHVVNCTAAFPS